MSPEIRPRLVQPLAIPEIVTLPAEIDISNAVQAINDHFSDLGENHPVSYQDLPFGA